MFSLFCGGKINCNILRLKIDNSDIVCITKTLFIYFKNLEKKWKEREREKESDERTNTNQEGSWEAPTWTKKNPPKKSKEKSSENVPTKRPPEHSREKSVERPKEHSRENKPPRHPDPPDNGIPVQPFPSREVSGRPHREPPKPPPDAHVHRDYKPPAWTGPPVDRPSPPPPDAGWKEEQRSGLALINFF